PPGRGRRARARTPRGTARSCGWDDPARGTRARAGPAAEARDAPPPRAPTCGRPRARRRPPPARHPAPPTPARSPGRRAGRRGSARRRPLPRRAPVPGGRARSSPRRATRPPLAARATATSEPREKRAGISGMGRAGRRGCARLSGRHPLLLFGQPLAIDAVTRERQRLQALVADGLAAALAVAERAVVDPLQSGDDVTEKAILAVAQLEEEFTRIGGVGLVAEILDRVVFLILAVEGGTAHLVGELTMLFDQALPELRQSILSHQRPPLRRRRARVELSYASTRAG